MKAIVSLSGGMDSATVLAEAISRDREVQTVGFTYGSKHNIYENRAAEAVAEHYGVCYRLIDLTAVFEPFSSSLLKSGGAIPEGHYEDTTMTQTVVPGRNMIFASILAGLAMSEGAVEVWLGIHAGDHAIYADCRPEFFCAMADVVREATMTSVRLRAPFVMSSKKAILKKGLKLEVPYHLTRTCYKDQELACGKCGACNERLEAFWHNRVTDEVGYE